MTRFEIPIQELARADRFQDLAVAELLFDWTVRNVQLESDAPRGQPATPHPQRPQISSQGQSADRPARMKAARVWGISACA